MSSNKDGSDNYDYTLQPHFLITLGALSIFGCLGLAIGCTIAPFYVPDYNWITDTISDLAAGHSELVMDYALYTFAGSLFCNALAASHAHSGSKRWSAGIFCLTILAALVIVIGARNEYGDNDNGGLVIHIYLVYALGFLFFVVPLCMAFDLIKDHKITKFTFIGCAALWAVLAAVFFLVPTSFDGLIERILGLIACIIIIALGNLFIHLGRVKL